MIMTVLLILISSILTPILLKVLYSKELPLKNQPATAMAAAGGDESDNAENAPSATSESGDAAASDSDPD